jgi:hypothetical protein
MWYLTRQFCVGIVNPVESVFPFLELLLCEMRSYDIGQPILGKGNVPTDKDWI